MMPTRGRGLLSLAWSRTGARKVWDARQRRPERVGDPGPGHEVVMGDVVADRQEGQPAGREPRRERGAKAHAAIGEHALQLGMLAAGGLAIGGEEERRRTLGEPVGELIDLGEQAVEQHDTMHAPIDAADRKRIGGRIVAAAIARDDDGGPLEPGARLRIAMQTGELPDGLVEELAEHARLPEPAAR